MKLGDNSMLASLWTKLLSVVQLLLSTSDTSTEAGRARERQRRIALSAGTAALAKVISVSTALISVPLTLHYLGAERYGMWMTMSSFIALLSFADLGIGNGLLSSIASANGREDKTSIQSSISSGYFLLTTIAFTLLVLFFCSYQFVPWHRIFNVKTDLAKAEAGPAMAVLVACFTLAMPLSIVQRVQMALQNGFTANIWQCFASIVGLIAVLIAIHLEAPLPYLVLGFAGAPLLSHGLNSLVFFLHLRRDIAPSRRFASRLSMQAIAGTGLLFFVLQIVSAASYSSNTIIIAQILGASAVAEYAVPEKLFALIGTVLSMMIAPLWPAYSEAIARGDHVWVKKVLEKSLLISIGTATLCSLPLVLFGPWIISMWVGKAVYPTMSLLLGFGVWKIIEAGGLPVAMYLNGANIVGFQVTTAIITAIVAVALKIYLTHSIGISGVLWATSFSFLLFTAIPLFVKITRSMKY